MRDLFVNGCSFATGWHGGKQEIPVITSRDVITDTLSWVQHFANMNNVQNCWNHSILAKPIELTYADTVGFCEQYLNKYGSFDDLFIIIELTDPSYREFDPVTLKGLAQHKEEDFIIKPIAFRSERSLVNKKSEPFQTIYVKMQKNIDYLGTDNFAEQISMKEVMQRDIARHRQERKFALHHEQSPFVNLEKTKDILDKLNNFLIENNIPHMIFWIGGRQQEYKNVMDKYYRKYMQFHRMIPTNTFTGIDYSLKHSVEPIGIHPDQLGHLAIAEFLTDYIRTYNLTQSPQLDLLEKAENIN